MELDLSLNQRSVLELIRRHQPVSRAELCGLSGLTSGALVRLTRELLYRGLIEIGEVVATGRGQPKQPLLISSDGGFSVGVAFYPRQMDLVKIDFSGKVLREVTHPFDDAPPAQTADFIGHAVRQFLGRPSVDSERCFGLGIAVPGYPTSDKSGLHTVEALASWRGSDMRQLVSQATGLDVWVENIASAGALAELYRQSSQGPRNIIFLHIGYGVGAGLIVGGRLYRGCGGNAGEVGMFFPLSEPRPSALDFLETVNTSGKGYETLAEIDFLLQLNNPVAQDWMDRASDQVAELAKVAKYWFAPDEFVVGGPFGDQFIAKFAEKLVHKISCIKDDMPPLSIRAAWAGQRVAAVGAAFLPIHHKCSPSPVA
ncbi:ROK family transcriptional regulator [Erythrobacter aureus]|uniref:ROK family transcriptional regulator n=1 Tax=Erythrobacter aureus TaxID=2182384 RepID=A0A345YH98_9SPHN|nr:ROK family transcriptional regulator [Erythrobacter aureus]AXK43300.1 ROK family transcriptional regulator [Erythrobacter aureus]